MEFLNTANHTQKMTNLHLCLVLSTPADRDDCVFGRRAYFTTHTFTTLGPVVIMLIKIVMVVSLIAVTQGHR